MRTVAIGDIHGCYDEFINLMDKLDLDLTKDKIIFLGDYIDRGVKSYEVVKYLMELQKKYPNNVVCLRGNHEDMAINHEKDDPQIWFSNGGYFTLKSFAENDMPFSKAIEWFKTLPIYYETETNVFVHGGIDPKKSLTNQDEKYMIWAREEYLYSTRYFKKTVISGHTPAPLVCGEDYTQAYYTMASNIVIDTGCFFSGILTACEVCVDENNKINYKFYRN